MTRLSLAAALVALAALAACEHDDMRTPIAIVTVTALPTLTAAQTHGLASVPWTVPAHTVITAFLPIEVPAAGCPQLRGAVLTETPTDVTVEVFATLTGCSDGPPGSIAAPVRLAAPLGPRHLHHGPTG